jgi:triacylglycerol lipase
VTEVFNKNNYLRGSPARQVECGWVRIKAPETPMTHLDTRFLAALTLAATALSASPVLSQRDAGGPLPTDPILLVHGFAGKGVSASGGYFQGVAGSLRRSGAQVFIAEVAPFASSETRGRQLATAIDDVLLRSGAERVHLIAHSQGGLDARFAIARLGYGDRVRSLTTISTPHRGSPVAVAVQQLPDFLRAQIPAILNASLVAEEGAGDIDAALNTLANGSDSELSELGDVPVFSIAGITAGTERAACEEGIWDAPTAVATPSSLLLPTWVFLGDIASDGAVPVDSARFGSFLGCVALDHFSELGADAEGSRAHLPMYDRILEVIGELEAWERAEGRRGHGLLAMR